MIKRYSEYFDTCYSYLWNLPQSHCQKIFQCHAHEAYFLLRHSVYFDAAFFLEISHPTLQKCFAIQIYRFFSRKIFQDSILKSLLKYKNAWSISNTQYKGYTRADFEGNAERHWNSTRREASTATSCFPPAILILILNHIGQLPL